MKMTEKIATSEEHPDEVEAAVVEEDLSGDEPVEVSDNELDDLDFDSIDVNNVPVLEEGADD
jgi:hypothetical protein